MTPIPPVPTDIIRMIVEPSDFAWRVEIVCNGNVTERMFETEELARGFMDGERTRLGSVLRD